jgi:integrase
MPAAPKLERHANGRYYIYWIEGRRTLRASTRTDDLTEAKRVFAGWLTGEHGKAKTSDLGLAFSEVWAQYVKEVADGTASGKRMPAMTPRFDKAFGDLPVADIGQAHIDKYARDRQAGRLGKIAADSTVWLELTKLRAAINHAIKRKRVPATAKPEFDMPVGPPEARDRWLRQEEFAKLVQAAAARRHGGRLSRLERFLMIAIETGARCRVIETLTWDQVDLETGVIHYDRRGAARSNKRRPSVPISNALRPVLERAYAERTNNLVLDAERAVYMHLVETAKEAGVPGVSPHVIRHTAATWMARRGVPLWKIAGILGNSVAIVEAVYAKHSPDGLVDAVEKISGSHPLVLAA